MVLPASSKVGLGNNYHSLNVYDVVQQIRRINRYNELTEVKIFHHSTNMRQHVLLKTYSKFPLINKQPNAILKFCVIEYHWCKAGGNTMPNLVVQSLTSYILNICALTFHHLTGSFFAYTANY